MNSKTLKRILKTLAWPLSFYIISELLCFFVKGRHLMTSMLDVQTLIRETGIAAMIAFALSLNLKSGRFDLSLGAQRLAGTIIGGIIAMNIGLSGLWLVLFAAFFGLIFGFITGIVFITLRVPPMVLGIGMGLILECMPYIVSGGKGLNLFGYAGIDVINNTFCTIAMMVLVGAFVYILMNKTRFGYQNKAVSGSQTISLNSGINIFRNALMCYTFAGGLVCLSAIIDTAYTTQLSSTMGLGSTAVVSSNMFPMLLGGYIGAWSNDAIGIIIASLAIKIFSYCLTMLEFSEPACQVANMVLFIAFLIFLSNKDFFRIRRAEKARIREAEAKKKEMGITR